MENKEKTVKFIKVPILNIRQLTDEDWNRLAYRNALERRAIKNGTTQTVH